MKYAVFRAWCTTSAASRRRRSSGNEFAPRNSCVVCCRSGCAPQQWSLTLRLDAPRVHVRHMKTKWGSCSPARRSIRLNTELAKKPYGCLECIVVHELGRVNTTI
ncbi:M48 family metallopeptidase [Dyella sp.]|uniref:M48 metallopeptidase family protein n=1 Tax=Dyella sp. TaxID=1869338 RepID=UPI002FDA2D93